jgi:hypothetical protein
MTRTTVGLAAGVVLLGAGLAAGLAYSVGGVGKPKAVVVYHVASEPGLFSTPRPSLSEYKRAQAVLVTQPITLEAALRDPAVQGLSTVPADGAVEWLTGRLKVDLRGNSEFFAVMLDGGEPEEQLALLGAVDRAYRAASFEQANARRWGRRATLEREHAAAHAALQALRGRLGAADSQADRETLAREVEKQEGIVALLAGHLEAMRIEGDAPSRVTVFEEPRIVRWGY